MKILRLAIPLALILSGLLLLIGCLPIPATQQLQPNLKPRPEFYVGSKTDSPVRLGQTRIEDAFIELSQRVQGMTPDGWMDLILIGKTYPMAPLSYWSVSPDGRHFSVLYEVRKVTWVMPLCFQAIPGNDTQYLILDVDANGVVVGQSTTTKWDGPFGATKIARWLEVFDEPTRRKLHEAGVFPSEEQIQVLLQNERELNANKTEVK